MLNVVCRSFKSRTVPTWSVPISSLYSYSCGICRNTGHLKSDVKAGFPPMDEEGGWPRPPRPMVPPFEMVLQNRSK